MLDFAYASDLLQTRLKSGGGPSARFVSTGFIRNYRFAYSQESKVWKGGVADIVPSEDDVVWGVVYRLSNEDLDGMDKQKGVGKTDPLYERINVVVEREESAPLKCITYSMVDARRDKKGFLPSPQYRE